MAEKPKKKKKSIVRRILFWFSLVCLLLAALGVGAGVGFWFWVTADLPRIEKLADYRPPAVTQILSAEGQLMAEYFSERRYVVPLSQVSPLVVSAFVAAEDGSFFEHGGLDYLGIIRAAIANLRAGRVVQGASTITQQVAKALLLSPRRTWMRKIREMILAHRIESFLTKREILFLYLNQIYLGHGAYGVEAAAVTYFGKKAKDLNLAEGALLAGLVQAPSRYSPLRHPRRARTRQVYVINRMVANKFITPAQAKAALSRQMDIRPHRPPTVHAPYYSEAVRQWLEEKYGKKMLYEGGLTVRTACGAKLTSHAQQAVNHGLDSLTKRQGYTGPTAHLARGELAAELSRPVGELSVGAGSVLRAVVARAHPAGRYYRLRVGVAWGRLAFSDMMWARRRPPAKPEGKASWSTVDKVLKPGDVVYARLVKFVAKPGYWVVHLVRRPTAQAAVLAIESGTGRVRVIVGGRDFAESQFNRALQSRRQPGSAFKPFIYAAAIAHPSHKYSAAATILDAPVVYDDPSTPGAKWKPKNYSNRFYGATTLRTALEHSRNVVTVRLLADLGLPYTVKYAKRFGFTSPITPNLSLALGTSGLSLLELTRAYSVFVNGGRLVQPVMIESVADRMGNLIYKAKEQAAQVISPETAYVMTSILRGVVQRGTGRRMLALKRPVAGKTGTTNDLRDAWFVGFAPQLVCGVWVGQDQNMPLGPKETGARAAGPVWFEFMKQALAGLPVADFTTPPGIVFARIDFNTGHLMPPGQAGGFFEAFLKGTKPGPAPRKAAGGDPNQFMQNETFGQQ